MRSYWKGPYFSINLFKKLILTEIQEKKKKSNKTKSESTTINTVVFTRDRNSTILKNFVGRTIAIYNGQRYYFIRIKPEYVGHKLGEFTFTRKTASYKKKRNKKKKNFKK